MNAEQIYSTEKPKHQRASAYRLGEPTETELAAIAAKLRLTKTAVIRELVRVRAIAEGVAK